MTYRYYDAERVGALPANYTIPWRGPAFLQEIGPKDKGFGNMTGGFMTGELSLPIMFTRLQFTQPCNIVPMRLLCSAIWRAMHGHVVWPMGAGCMWLLSRQLYMTCSVLTTCRLVPDCSCMLQTISSP